jgi:hypothetical protein
LPEMISGNLVGSAPPPDRFDTKNNAVAPGERAELEISKYTLKRANKNGEAESYAQKEERRYKERVARLEAEELEALQHSRITWLRHLRRCYARRLEETEQRLKELGVA